MSLVNNIKLAMRSLSISTSAFTLVVLVILVALAIPASGLVIPSNYSGLIVGAPVFFILLVLVWIKRPVYVIYLFIFYSFLPYGIIPSTPFYYLNRFFPFLVAGIWLFDVIRQRRRVIITLPSICMFGFMLWSVITLFWAQDLATSEFILELYFTRFIIFVLIIPDMIRSRKDLDGLMDTMALNGWLLVFASGIALALTGYSSGVRFQVFQENSNYIGILALLMLAGVAWQAFGTPRRNRWLWQGLVYIYLLASILIVAMTGSRGSALSLFVILLVFLAGKQTRGLGIVGICCVILGLVLAPIIFSTTIERFTVFDQENTILGGRETLWPAAWMMIKDHPWAGVGIGNSEVKLISYLQNFINTIGEESTSGHNPILTIWMETGIPGFVLYMGSLVTAVILFMRELIKRRFHRKNSYRTYFDIVGAIFLGYMVTWIKGGGIESDKTFFLMLALLLLPLSMNRIVNFNNHPAAQKRG